MSFTAAKSLARPSVVRNHGLSSGEMWLQSTHRLLQDAAAVRSQWPRVIMSGEKLGAGRNPVGRNDDEPFRVEPLDIGVAAAPLVAGLRVDILADHKIRLLLYQNFQH